MQLKDLLLSLAQDKTFFKMTDVLKVSKKKYSSQYISKTIKELVGDGKLMKGGVTRSAYYYNPKKRLPFVHSFSKRYRNDSLQEHFILLEARARTGLDHSRCPENVSSIFDYTFSEMLNNAIEHSHSKYIQVFVTLDDRNLRFVVDDYGVGVFHSVMSKKKLAGPTEAIQDLMKGKTTTAPQAHSGEGIFFSSKCADVFQLQSGNTELYIDNAQDKDVYINSLKPKKRGTRVIFSIPVHSTRHISEIFLAYQTDPEEPAFDKTEIKVKLFSMGSIHVSRSQARRLLSGLDKFKTVVLDFDEIPSIGQAFSDEIFRVFVKAHPEVNLIPTNMVESVQFMVERAQNT